MNIPSQLDQELAQRLASPLLDVFIRAGLILARQQQYAVGEHLRRLLRLMTQLTAEERHNRVEFLSAWGETGGEHAR